MVVADKHKRVEDLLNVLRWHMGHTGEWEMCAQDSALVRGFLAALRARWELATWIPEIFLYDSVAVDDAVFKESPS